MFNLPLQKSAPRDRVYTRALHDVGDLVSGRPQELHITYSQHYCKARRKYFSADLTDVAPRGSHYTHRIMASALRVVVEDSLPYRNASWQLGRDHRVFVPFATIQNWVEAGKKRRANGGTATIWRGLSPTFLGTSPPMNCMMIPFVSCRLWTTAPSTVYRVRTYLHIVARLALDLFREAAMQPRTATLTFLHSERARP